MLFSRPTTKAPIRHLLQRRVPSGGFSCTHISIFKQRCVIMATKRKASTVVPEMLLSKKIKIEQIAAGAKEHNIVNRKYYPPEISQERCLQYNRDEIKRPIQILQDALRETKQSRDQIEVKGAVVHWFKQDLRTRDNTSLHLASEKAKSKNVPLIALYIISPQDYEAHITSKARVDFTLRTLQGLKQDLAELDIPLYVETVEKRKRVPARILELCKEWGASHLFANMELEVDELRREALLVRTGIAQGIAVDVLHDTCVVEPGRLRAGSGKQYSVYTPWFRAFVAFLHANPSHLKLKPSPTKNPVSVRLTHQKLFEAPIPEAPASKALNDEEIQRYRGLWPVGEQEAHERLAKFLTKRIHKYKDMRNLPAEDGTSTLSVHFSSGTLSARTAIAAAQKANSTMKLDAGNPGIMTWISEVAWRDFYKHVLVNWPFVCMNKCFKPEYTSIVWENNADHLEAWKKGQTGYPLVDAGMRQAVATGYMHNRVRMVVASFLAKHLLLDWRLGEQYFMELLIDGDFASNSGGWGFSSSAGVDPQPYFRIFNPTLQSEKFDAEGAYIKKWVPELKDVKGKALHEPYAKGAGLIAKKNGYPQPIVEHKFARARALSRYKEGLGKGVVIEALETAA